MDLIKFIGVFASSTEIIVQDDSLREIDLNIFGPDGLLKMEYREPDYKSQYTVSYAYFEGGRLIIVLEQEVPYDSID